MFGRRLGSGCRVMCGRVMLGLRWGVVLRVVLGLRLRVLGLRWISGWGRISGLGRVLGLWLVSGLRLVIGLRLVLGLRLILGLRLVRRLRLIRGQMVELVRMRGHRSGVLVRRPPVKQVR